MKEAKDMSGKWVEEWIRANAQNPQKPRWNTFVQCFLCGIIGQAFTFRLSSLLKITLSSVIKNCFNKKG